MNPQYAVIFDVDGVLIDSYQAHWRSWQALALQTGVSFAEQDFAASFGRTSRDVIRKHWPELQSEQAVNYLDDRKESLFRDEISMNFPQMPGAVELIDQLHDAGFLLAAGSSAPPANVHLTLDRLDRADAFSAIITGRDVTRGKPDPQVFLLSSQKLNVPPSQCAVIEDAPAGIQAARSAKMLAIALLSTGRHREDFIDCLPDIWASSLRELTPQRIAEAIQAHAKR
jgi:beta-phosphoglucomutase